MPKTRKQSKRMRRKSYKRRKGGAVAPQKLYQDLKAYFSQNQTPDGARSVLRKLKGYGGAFEQYISLIEVELDKLTNPNYLAQNSDPNNTGPKLRDVYSDVDELLNRLIAGV